MLVWVSYMHVLYLYMFGTVQCVSHGKALKRYNHYYSSSSSKYFIISSEKFHLWCHSITANSTYDRNNHQKKHTIKKRTPINTVNMVLNNNNRIQRRYSRFFTRTLKWPGRNCVQITCNTSSAFHVQVSCYVPLGTKGQFSY